MAMEQAVLPLPHPYFSGCLILPGLRLLPAALAHRPDLKLRRSWGQRW